MGYNYSRSRTALHCSLGPLMAATYLRDEVLTAGIFIINSLIFSSWWRTIGGDKISRLAARPQQSINEKKLWGISTDKLFLCPSVPNKAEFENSTLQQKEWSIIFKLPSPGRCPPLISVQFNRFFTFVLWSPASDVSTRARLPARALIYKSLSLFMIKSLKTKLGRSRGGQICCGLLPATCGIIPADGCTAALAAARCARHEHGLNIF